MRGRRRGPGGVQGLRQVRYDAGGQRMRAQRREEAHRATMIALKEATERDEAFIKRAKPLPLIESLGELATIVETKKPEAPVYILGKRLMEEGALKTVFPGGPGMIAFNTSDRNTGAHFDDWRHLDCPWTVHSNPSAHGVIKACFLPTSSLRSYESRREVKDLSDDQLAELRQKLGTSALELGKEVFLGSLTPGQATLLWHGSWQRERGIPNPGVHSIERDFFVGSTDYHIYALNNRDNTIPEGFVRTR